jgi:hypothetical protein
MNILPGEKFVLEVSPNSMKLYQKPSGVEIKEVETFIPLHPAMGMSDDEIYAYVKNIPKLQERFGEEVVLKALESDIDKDDSEDEY